MNQETGEDLNPNRRRHMDTGGGEETLRNPDRPVEVTVLDIEEDSKQCKKLTKITDLEKWEIKQVFIRRSDIKHMSSQM